MHREWNSRPSRHLQIELTLLVGGSSLTWSLCCLGLISPCAPIQSKELEVEWHSLVVHLSFAIHACSKTTRRQTGQEYTYTRQRREGLSMLNYRTVDLLTIRRCILEVMSPFYACLSHLTCLLVGGLIFEGPQNQDQKCSQEGESCGRIVLLNTSFVYNYAKDLGSAILSTNAKDVLVSCSYDRGRQKSFLNQGNLALLAVIDHERLCESWKENHIARSRIEGVVGTFGRKLSLSINSTNSSTDVQLHGNIITGFVLENVASGKRLPEIKVLVVDAFGNGLAPTIPRSMLATVMSPEKFFQGVMTFSIAIGYGQFSGIVGVTSPGYYTIKITPHASSLDESILKIHVRNCYIGEQPTRDGKLCETCDAFSYNFNVDEPGGCTHCPEGSTCEGHYINPKDGYWHKGPCYDKVKECITEEACKYETRHHDLVKFTKNLNNCTMNTTSLETYNDVQCNEVGIFVIVHIVSLKRLLQQGYKGSLCGSCEKSYGLSSNLECLKCGFVLFSILRLVAIIVYLLVGTSLTIRATLPILSRRLFRQHAMTPLLAASSSALIEARATPREGEITQEEDSVHQVSTGREEVSLSRMASRRASRVTLVQDNVIETWKVSSCVSFFDKRIFLDLT